MLKIQKTTQYNQFNFLTKKNREPHPRYLIESITKKNMLEEHPILCDVHLNVIDGQNRLRAAEALGLPIYYIVSDNISEEDISHCQVQNPWVLSDFLKFYIDLPNYAFVQELITRFGLPIHFIVYCCNFSKNANKDFRSGTFTIKKDFDEIRKKMQQLKDVVNEFVRVRRETSNTHLCISSKLYRSLWSLVNMKDYKHKEMIQKCRNYPENVAAILTLVSEQSISEALRKRVHDYYMKGKEKKNKGKDEEFDTGESDSMESSEPADQKPKRASKKSKVHFQGDDDLFGT